LTIRNIGDQTTQIFQLIVRSNAGTLADGALTTVVVKVRHADDLLTEKNCLNPSKTEGTVNSYAQIGLQTLAE
jgi:hypothetical protein